MATTFLHWRTQEQPKLEPRDYVNGIMVRLVKHKQDPLIRSTLVPSWYAKNSERNDDFKDHQRQTLTSATDAGETDAMAIWPSSFDENTPSSHPEVAPDFLLVEETRRWVSEVSKHSTTEVCIRHESSKELVIKART